MNAFDPRVRAWLERIFDPEEARDAVLLELEEEAPELRALVRRALALGGESRGEDAGSSAPTIAAVRATGRSASAPEFPGYAVVGELRPGGMSQVYRARVIDDPEGDDVAIKVVHALDVDLLDRFDREVAILAKLDHPQIARLLDRGTLSDGRPFLVMEYVDGQTIGDFATSLDATEIADLVRKLCGPLAYCHERGIWHRDIKPSNVVVRPDGTPVLIDFGIAKAESYLIQQTATLNRAMTFLYAAPEQAEGRCTDATDTYAVGMLLYQLLAGRIAYDATTPLAMAEALRLRDPLPLESALAGGDRPSIANALARIVDKAIRKEPERRYLSARSLEADLARYLRGERVDAKKDDPIYLARRTARRHRAALAVTLAWAVAASILVWIARAERDEAEDARRDAEVAKHNSDVVIATLNQAMHLAEKVPGYLEEIPIHEMVETTELTRRQLTGEPAARAQLAITVGIVQRDLANYDEAIEVLSAAVPNLDGELAIAARTELAGTLHRAGRFDEAKRWLSSTLDDCLNLGIACPATLNELGLVEADDGDLDRAEITMRRALVSAERAGAAWELAEAQTNLSIVLGFLGRYEEAIDLAREALTLRSELVPSDHLMVAEANNNVGMVLGQSGNFREAEEYLTRAYDLRVARLGRLHPWSLQSMNNLAQCLLRMESFDAAEAAFREALDGYRDLYPPNHLKPLNTAQNLALLLIDREKFTEAENLLEEVLQHRRTSGSERHLASTLLALGKLHLEQGRPERVRAYEELQQADELLTKTLGEQNPKTLEARAVRALSARYLGDATAEAVCEADGALRAVEPPTARTVTGNSRRLERHGIDCRKIDNGGYA